VPAFIKGVVNLRGVIMPIVDMRVRFGLEDVQYNSFTVVIILNISGRMVGMVVDSVSDVLELDPGQIKPTPEFSGAVDASYITGLGTAKSGDEERMLILMDIESMMKSPRWAHRQRAALAGHDGPGYCSTTSAPAGTTKRNVSGASATLPAKALN